MLTADCQIVAPSAVNHRCSVDAISSAMPDSSSEQALEPCIRTEHRSQCEMPEPKPRLSARRSGYKRRQKHFRCNVAGDGHVDQIFAALHDRRESQVRDWNPSRGGPSKKSQCRISSTNLE